jgi:patatin-related protein
VTSTGAQPVEAERQEVRIAVVMNGGVSLAIWISGVAMELHRIVSSGRMVADQTVREYQALLQLLLASVRIDVISGTSAGGLNGGFLAVGLTRDAPLDAMGVMWADQGAFLELLRQPQERNPASLLRGDGHFLPTVAKAYRTIWDAGRTKPAAEQDDPLELILTCTLWDGRRTTFTDDMRRSITEVDYDGRFRFTNDGERTLGAAGDLTDERVLRQLAVASRCTSSFPGAFEPHLVTPLDQDGAMQVAAQRQQWPSSGGMATFEPPTFAVDGGVLLNKPIRPALEAVYRQSASAQVRRLLVYVVPNPGVTREQTAPPPATSPRPSATPKAQEVLLGVLTRLRSTDSVSRELQEIRAQNDATRLRRRTRERLATALVDTASDGLAEAAWPAYRETRVEQSVRTIAALIAAGLPAGEQDPDSSGRSKTRLAWSEQEVATALRRVAAARRRAGRSPLPFVPGGKLGEALARAGADWDWGQTTVRRLGDIAIDVLRRAMWLAPLTPDGVEDRRAVAEARGRVHATLQEVAADRSVLDRDWRSRGANAPDVPDRARGRDGDLTAAATADLDEWITRELAMWAATGPGRDRARLHAQAERLAAALHDCGDALASVAADGNRWLDPDDTERPRLEALVKHLLKPSKGARTARDVLRRMLELDVVQLAFAGATADVEQEVELVQVSSSTPDLLTGIQEHHFGAFYRRSWRVNDWLRGRLDGTEQLVTALLEPKRLRQRALTTSELDAALHQIVVGDASPADEEYFRSQWDRRRVERQEELDRLELDDPKRDPPYALPVHARLVAMRAQTDILAAELPALAKAVVDEPDGPGQGRQWARDCLALFKAPDGSNVRPPAAQLWQQLESSAVIGGQRIRDDVEAGTDTLARTVSKAVAVLANNVAALTRPRVVATVLSALRGYALVLWAMVSLLTGRSNVGAALVRLAVATGGALLALALVVPGVPLVFTLVSVLLLLAGASAAGLLQQRTRGIGARLLLPALATALALGVLTVLAIRDVRDKGADALVWSALIKVLVVLLVILVGVWVARVRKRPEPTLSEVVPASPESESSGG